MRVCGRYLTVPGHKDRDPKKSLLAELHGVDPEKQISLGLLCFIHWSVAGLVEESEVSISLLKPCQPLTNPRMILHKGVPEDGMRLAIASSTYPRGKVILSKCYNASVVASCGYGRGVAAIGASDCDTSVVFWYKNFQETVIFKRGGGELREYLTVKEKV
jgi:hypothetical protein